MEIFEYDKKLGYQYRKCEVCSKKRICCQHHFDEGRHSKKVIWVCDNKPKEFLYVNPCHQKIHANPEWAYEKGYLTKMSSKIMKKGSKPSKWEIKKKHSPASKWMLDFTKRGKK
jgi:hypothetical protein